MFRKWKEDDQGVAYLLAALLLPIFLILMGMLIDLGTLIFKRGKFKATVELAAEAGASMIGDLIIEKAQANNPPPDATDPLLYIDDDDRAAIAADPRVTQEVTTYIQKNLPNQSPQVAISYPDNTIDCDGQPNQKRIDLKVTATDSLSLLFANLLKQSVATINASALQSVQICPS